MLQLYRHYLDGIRGKIMTDSAIALIENKRNFRESDAYFDYYDHETKTAQENIKKWTEAMNIWSDVICCCAALLLLWLTSIVSPAYENATRSVIILYLLIYYLILERAYAKREVINVSLDTLFGIRCVCAYDLRGAIRLRHVRKCHRILYSIIFCRINMKNFEQCLTEWLIAKDFLKFKKKRKWYNNKKGERIRKWNTSAYAQSESLTFSFCFCFALWQQRGKKQHTKNNMNDSIMASHKQNSKLHCKSNKI